MHGLESLLTPIVQDIEFNSAGVGAGIAWDIAVPFRIHCFDHRVGHGDNAACVGSPHLDGMSATGDGAIAQLIVEHLPHPVMPLVQSALGGGGGTLA